MPKAGIEYVHVPALGGLRMPKKESVNTAWQNARFRAYADFMQSEEFEDGLRAVGLNDVSVTATHSVADGMFSAIVKATKGTDYQSAIQSKRDLAVSAGCGCGNVGCC